MATDFSRTLSLLRQEKGISQRKAAAALGISQALLSHYENGIREPGLAFVARACDFYHVSADFLLGRTNSRDGSIIEAAELYDASDEKGTLKGSILATLQKKLVVNTTGVLFDLLGKCGDRTAITAAGDYLSTALYTLLRHLYRCGGGNEDVFLAVCWCTGTANAQDIAAKTNLLYWSSTTPNLSFEFGLGKRTTLDLTGAYNPWTLNKDSNKKIKHWLVMPEFRYWLCERYNGHFFGLHSG